MFGRKELAWFKSRARTVTKRDLRELERKLMSMISEFVAKQNELGLRIDTAVEEIKKDIDNLKSKLPTPEDQASLNTVTARTEALANTLEGITRPVNT